MIIRIFKDGDCLRYIEVEEEAAWQLFNLILQSLGVDEEIVMYSGDEQRVVATGC